ncbi:MAG: hypothetical protein M3Y70_06455 [Pseudomonadota bacterium]|nr:hypothetical protein [Pseudomonadota bacterium]
MRQILAIAALIATGMMPGQEFVPVQSPGTTVEAIATPDRTTLSTALRAAIRDGFPTQDVRIRVARIESGNAGPAQRELKANGRILLDDAGDWIDFKATALYDLEAGTATTTSLLMAPPRELVFAADPALVEELTAETTRRLRAEFASQPATIEVGQVRSRPAGDLMALVADGQAHFGNEGSAVATIRALYDPRSGQWLRLDYELGSGG